MRMQETAKTIGGSIAVYVIMAACSASSGTIVPPQGDDGGQVGGNSSSGGAASDGSGGGALADGARGILDALTDPVTTASADTTQSGSRLKLQYYVGSDGSKVSTGGIYDSQLNVTCYYTAASDGTTRCLPSGGATLGTEFFSDSGCTQAIAYTTTSCGTAPRYATQAQAAACGYQDHVYPVSGAFTGTVYEGSPSSCTPISDAPGASQLSQDLAASFAAYSFYSVGSELPPSTFVEAMLQTD